jgi:hypothetical protein
MSRKLVPLAALAILMLSGCTTRVGKMDWRATCDAGVGSKDKNHPAVCVDNLQPALSVDPVDVRAFDRKADKEGRASALPVMVHWYTRSGAGNLQIIFDKEGCVENVQCDGRGHCSANTIKRGNANARQCKYTVYLGNARLDPTVIVQPCCAVGDMTPVE